MPQESQSVPPETGEAHRHRPSRQTVLLAILVAVALVAVTAAVPLAALPWSPLLHYECAPGATVATRELWTPVVLVNAPYAGFGNGTGKYPLPNGWWSENFTVANGGAAASLELDEWSIAPAVRVVVAGPGANAVCRGYVGTVKLEGEYMSVTLLPAGAATSDAAENTSFTRADPYGNGYDSVLFDNGYSEGDLTLSTCGGGGIVMGAFSDHLAVRIPFTLDGTGYTASATISGTYNYTYTFPGQTGTWSIDDLNTGAHAPGGGWAFSFTPCAS